MNEAMIRNLSPSEKLQYNIPFDADDKLEAVELMASDELLEDNGIESIQDLLDENNALDDLINVTFDDLDETLDDVLDNIDPLTLPDEVVKLIRAVEKFIEAKNEYDEN